MATAENSSGNDDGGLQGALKQKATQPTRSTALQFGPIIVPAPCVVCVQCTARRGSAGILGNAQR
jgi:hypothetical protein